MDGQADIQPYAEGSPPPAASATLWLRALDAVSYAVILVDRDRRIMQANRAAECLFGQGALPGKFCYQVVHGADSPPDYCGCCESFDTGESLDLKVQERNPVNRWLSIRTSPLKASDGEVAYLGHVFRDITDSRGSQHALGERIKELDCFYSLAELVESSGNDLDAILQGITEALANAMQFPDRAYARTICGSQEFYSQDFASAPMAVMEQAIHIAGEEVGSVRVGYIGSAQGSQDPGPEFLPEERKLLAAVAGRLGKIIERVELRRHEQLSHKMELIGQLASGIAHDLNNVLTGAIGYAEILQSHLSHDQKLLRYARGIHTACKRGAGSISQLLLFARKDGHKQQAVDLHAIIHDVVGLLSHSIGPSIHISCDLQAKNAWILADGGTLQNALLNLGTNARASMPEGGELEYICGEITLKEGDPEAGRLALQAGPYIQLRVRDTGCGMNRDTSAKALEPFYTTKTGSKGTGLGLASVYACAQIHEGAMEIESDPGCGTMVSLYLPQRSVTPPKVQVNTVQTSREKGAGHVLVVDDERLVREMSCDMLRHLGYDVTACNDGAEAIDLCSEAGTAFDLILLDLMMAKKGGIETIARLREMQCNTPIVVSSGQLTDEVRGKLEGLGVIHILAKPFDEVELASSVMVAMQSTDPSGHEAAPPQPVDNEEAPQTCAATGPIRTSPRVSSVARGAVQVLVVDDDTMVRHSLLEHLNDMGYRVWSAHSGESATTLIAKKTFDVVITDLQMGQTSGIDVLKTARAGNPGCIVLIMTAYATVESSLEALVLGADDYFPKPVNIQHLDLVIQRAISERRLRKEHADLLQRTERLESLCDMVGASDAMNRVYRSIRTFSSLDSTVLIHGETGTGKELAARALHTLSPRSDAPFLAVNCGSLPDALLEGELFGHTKGAFTGAIADKDGLLVAAGRGTVFLDEIEAASPKAQASLLRALDMREVRRVGGRKSVPVEARILVASNRELEGMIEEGLFREDLYYRIAEGEIHMPPLRDRLDDIPLLANHFFRLAASGPKQRRSFSPQSLSILHQYSWPGNVREFRNLVTGLAASAPRPLIKPIDLPARIREGQTSSSHLPTLEEHERKLLLQALDQCAGNKAEAARVLGTTRTRIYSLMKKHGIELPE